MKASQMCPWQERSHDQTSTVQRKLREDLDPDIVVEGGDDTKTGKIRGDRGAPQPQDLVKSLQRVFKLLTRNHNPLRKAPKKD